MSRSRRLASLLLVASLCFALVGVAGAPRAAMAAPSSWDKRVLPIAREVEKLRGLEFEHPVPVDFLSRRRVQQERRGHPRLDVGRRHGRSPARAVATALDRAPPATTSTSSTPLDAADVGRTRQVRPEDETCHRSGKEDRRRHEGDARARAHARAAGPALRPQQAPRKAVRDHSADALQALVEGDARRVQLLYVDQLSKAERGRVRAFQASGVRSGAGGDAGARTCPTRSTSCSRARTRSGQLDARSRGGRQRQDGDRRAVPRAADGRLVVPHPVDAGRRTARFTKVAAPS